ncbi:MAG TPA: hypothetical protein VF071_11905 [Candidatus Limnocylindria bacterium]
MGQRRAVDYPASWTDWGPDEPISLMRPTLLAYVGNLPVNTEEICEIGRATAGCDFSAYDMEPGGVVVAFVRWNLPGDGPSEGLGERVEVGGREARFSEEATERDSVMLRWAIDDPYASYLAVWAEIQGPREDRLRRQVEAVIASLEFTPPPT